MTIDEKLDLLIEEVSGIKGDVSSLKGDVSSLKGDVSSLKGDVSSLKDDVSTLKGDVSTLKGDMVEVKGGIASLDNRVTSLEDKFLKFRVYFENILEKKLDIMVEAQKVYEDRMPSIEQMERDVEFLKIDNAAEKTAISELYDRLKTA